MSLFKKLVKSQVETRKKLEHFSYDVQDIIGSGYSSKVFRGRNQLNSDPVAIKVIDVQMLNAQVNRTLLQSEIKILKSIDKIPNILMLYEIYSSKNNIYIITELCSTDLNKKIEKTHLSKQQVYRYMDHFLKGYSYLYEQRIIHRDLKPANLLITEKNILKIADFGFGIRQCQSSKCKYNVGSPLYMAPQSLKRTQYSFKSDIWAIGVILFEMLTGTTPWTAKTQRQLVKKVQNQPIQEILKKHKFQPFVKQFLTQTLAYKENERMDPETLLNFKFRQNQSRVAEIPKQTSTKDNDKMQKKKKQNQLGCSQFSLCVSRNIRKQANQNKSTSQNSNKHTKNTQMSSNRKFINGLVMAQINLCRFLFKTILKMDESNKSGILSTIKTCDEDVMLGLTGIIKEKISELKEFQKTNYMEVQNHKQYSEHHDCQKLVKYSSKYYDRFHNQLIKYWDNPKTEISDYYRTTKNILKVLEAIRNAFRKIFTSNNPSIEELELHKKDIVLLEAIIYSEEYLTMIMKDFKEDQNYESFARKTNIEETMDNLKAKINEERYELAINKVETLLKPSHKVL